MGIRRGAERDLGRRVVDSRLCRPLAVNYYSTPTAVRQRFYRDLTTLAERSPDLGLPNPQDSSRLQPRATTP